MLVQYESERCIRDSQEIEFAEIRTIQTIVADDVNFQNKNKNC